MKQIAGICFNLTIAFLLVVIAVSLVEFSFRYNELLITIDKTTAEIETYSRNLEKLQADDRLEFIEENIERILREAKPPCPIDVYDSIIFFEK